VRSILWDSVGFSRGSVGLLSGFPRGSLGVPSGFPRGFLGVLCMSDTIQCDEYYNKYRRQTNRIDKIYF
jgi:hypothetical protein